MFDRDYYDDGGGGSGGESRSGTEHQEHLLDPKEFVFKTSDETNRAVGELSKTSLSQALENYSRAYSDSIFARDSYTDIERTSLFMGFDVGLGFWAGKGKFKAALLVDNITGQLGIQFCMGAGGRIGTPVSITISALEVNPYSPGGVPDDFKVNLTSRFEAFAAYGFGISTDSRNESLIIGYGAEVSGTVSLCLTQRVRTELSSREIHY